MITLIVGGARSGKSTLAERLAAESGKEVVYVATARVGDPEMRERVRRHRERRPASWRTVEEPIQLARALTDHATQSRCILVDCLTLWLANLIFTDYPHVSEDISSLHPGKALTEEKRALLQALPELRGDIILVSNEVGMGIVPMGALNRFFADEAGLLNQAVARVSNRMQWVVAGCPVPVKGY